MADGRKYRRAHRWWTLALALFAGAIIAWMMYPVMQRELALRRLFSDDAGNRQTAAQWMLAPADSTANMNDAASRLAGDQPLAARIIERLELESDLDRAILGDAIGVLVESDWWDADFIPLNVWLRRVDLLLASQDEAAARVAIEQLRERPWSEREEADLAARWGRLLEWNADGKDPRIAHLALRRGAGWYGEAHAERPIVAPALEHESPIVRRRAWLMLGVINPIAGYSGDWQSEPSDAVAEAMLWSTVHTNPDRPEPVLRAVETTPWRTRALPWILAQSSSHDALVALEGLHIDGNPVAAIPLVEALEGIESVRVPPRVRAWLGLGGGDDANDADESSEETLFARWRAWRRAPTMDRRAFVHRFGSPVAEDGSVWAMVLLAERVLDSNEAIELADAWISNWDASVQRAGLLLSGLLSAHRDHVQSILDSSNDAETKRCARLARLMMSAPAEQASSDAAESTDLDFAFAQRLMEEASKGGRLDILLARLAAGDADAARGILDHDESIIEPSATASAFDSVSASASTQLLKHAWFIERFLPDECELVAPLSPWSESVARLQLDIMAASFDLRHDRRGFHTESRTFASPDR